MGVIKRLFCKLYLANLPKFTQPPSEIGELAPFPIIIIPAVQCLHTVSYTHLGVYKRQELKNVD